MFLCYDKRTMANLENLGQILILLIHYANDEDIFQLVKFYFPYVTWEKVTRKGHTVKEYLLEQLCEPQYRIFESVNNDDLKQVKKYLNTSRLEILINHLLMLQKCYFNNFLFVTHEEIKNEKVKDTVNERVLAFIKGKSSSKHGLERLLKEGNISEDEIPQILHILIDSYKKYDFYYLFHGDNIKKVKLTYQKGSLKYEETEYKIELLARKTNFINVKTNHKIEIDKPIRQFFINENGKSDILSISFNKFQKISTAIYEGLSKDIPVETCAWCNPDKYKQNQRKIYDNCNFLLEKIRLLQAKALISKFDIFNEMNKYSWKDYKTLKGLRHKRKEYLIELLDNFYGLNSSLARELSDLIDKSFSDVQ